MAQDSRNGSKGLCRVELNTLVRDYGECQRGERESCETISDGSSVGFQTRRNLHRNEKAAGKEIVKQMSRGGAQRNSKTETIPFVSLHSQRVRSRKCIIPVLRRGFIK